MRDAIKVGGMMKCGKCNKEMSKSIIDSHTTRWTCSKCGKFVEEVTGSIEEESTNDDL